MNQADLVTFNQAVSIAQAGDKAKAYTQLKALEQTNPDNPGLLLWLAFTSRDIPLAETYVDRANALDPTSQQVIEAKEWLAKQKTAPGYQPTPAPAAPAYYYPPPPPPPPLPLPYMMAPPQPQSQPPKISFIDRLNRRYKGNSKTDNLIALAILLVALAYLFLFIVPGHPPTWGPFYKEYSDATELYKNAALGDRGRVYINVTNPQPDKDGFIEYTRDIGNRAFFRIPQDKQSTIKLLPGKNIVYVQVTERHVNGIVCDIEEAKV